MKSIIVSLLLFAAQPAVPTEQVIVEGQGFDLTLTLSDTSGEFEVYHLPQNFDGTVSIPEQGIHSVPVQIYTLLPAFGRQFIVRPLHEVDRSVFTTLVLGTDAFDQQVVDIYYIGRFPLRRHLDYSVSGLGTP
jgi:hypothetical protein